MITRKLRESRTSSVSRIVCAIALAPILATCSSSSNSTPTQPAQSQNDAVTQSVGPAGGTVVTPSGAAGVQIPAGTFSQAVMLTITRLPAPTSAGAGPLPTSLKQYGPYYDFTTSPQVAQFGDSARVGVCQVTDPSSPLYPPEPHDRLRLAHSVGNSVQILDRVGVDDFLRCTNVSASWSETTSDPNELRAGLLKIRGLALRLLGPATLYAAHGGLGGKVKSFSPFGVVDQRVALVEVSLSNSTVFVGGSIQASAVLKDADGNILTGRQVAWTSSNQAVATVSSTGVVTGVSVGQVTISAMSEERSGSADLTVALAPVASVTVSPPAPTIQVGATVQLTATTRDASGNLLSGRTVTWTTSAASVATVSSTGLVTGVSAGGPAIITATSEGRRGTADVTVTANPFLVTTGQPPSQPAGSGYGLFARGSTTCGPQPACQDNFQDLAGQFTLGSNVTITAVEGWIGNGVGGLIDLNIRANSGGIPGAAIFSKRFSMPDLGAPGWVGFPLPNVDVAAGTYWVTFEPVAPGNLNVGMPKDAPAPLASYAFRNDARGWVSTAQSFGLRIQGSTRP